LLIVTFFGNLPQWVLSLLLLQSQPVGAPFVKLTCTELEWWYACITNDLKFAHDLQFATDTIIALID